MEFLDDLHVQLRVKEKRGSVRSVRACEAEEWPPRAASARATTATGGRRRRGDSAGEVADVEGPRLARGGGPRLSGEANWPELQCWSALLHAPERAFGWHRRALAALVMPNVPKVV